MLPLLPFLLLPLAPPLPPPPSRRRPRRAARPRGGREGAPRLLRRPLRARASPLPDLDAGVRKRSPAPDEIRLCGRRRHPFRALAVAGFPRALRRLRPFFAAQSNGDYRVLLGGRLDKRRRSR